MPLGIKFTPDRFAGEFVARRARRWLKALLDGIGQDKIIYLVQNNKMFTDYLTTEQQAKYRGYGRHYRQYAEFFSNVDVYGWVPEEYRDLIETLPNGKKWIYRQLSFIRRAMLSS